ncbi:hypothetical protein E2C01_030488 [Portunus trituberculatus]|uniref:DUF547 domain-containing protein n=1 Tax=Portunus trituberculatus TaxID=210409 RepID=A0A5B7EUD8_PORTR|nr:hypothetical protein [Portunus trituberculatus]
MLLIYILLQVDPRIHFALNCGAKSCPPIKTFSSSNVNEELRIATEAYLESDEALQVDEDQGIIRLSSLLKWYSSDFGETLDEVLQWVLQNVAYPKKKAALQSVVDVKKYKDPPTRRCLWDFASASWGHQRRYYADFPWNDYCFHVRDPSLCAEGITERLNYTKGDGVGEGVEGLADKPLLVADSPLSPNCLLSKTSLIMNFGLNHRHWISQRKSKSKCLARKSPLWFVCHNWHCHLEFNRTRESAGPFCFRHKCLLSTGSFGSRTFIFILISPSHISHSSTNSWL